MPSPSACADHIGYDGTVGRLFLLAVVVTGCATGQVPGGDPDAPVITFERDAAPPDARVNPAPPDANVMVPDPPDAAPTPCTATWQNLLTNASFDLGPSGWMENSGGGYPIVSASAQLPIPTHSGNYAAWTGGYDNAYDQVFQSVTIPADATSLRWSGYGCFASEEAPGSGVYDVAGVGLLNPAGTVLETLYTWSNLNAPSASSCTWTSYSQIASNAYAGQTVTLLVEAVTDSTLGTSFFFDTFVLEALACP